MLQSNTQAQVGSSGDTAGRFASRYVSRETLTWVFFAQGVSIVPLFFFLPFWLAVIWVAAVLLRVQIFRGVWPFPNTFVKFIFGSLGIVGLYLSYGGRMGVDPMIGLLVLAFVLKLIEVRSRQDVLIVLYIGFVAIAAQLLMAPNFWIGLYGLASCCVLLSALQQVFQHRRVSTKLRLWSGFSILLQALPVMLVLFLVMPRLGQLWAVPSLTETGKTGFSDSMSPGDFSNLIKSDAIAFRATFGDSRIPAPRQRYWRGLVLETFDGKAWKRPGGWYSVTANSLPSDQPNPGWNLFARNSEGDLVTVDSALSDETSFRYSVLLEPHNYAWLFTLVAPVEAYSDTLRTRFSPDVLLTSQVPVTSRSQYDVISFENYRFGSQSLSSKELTRNLKLPLQGNPRARAMAERWRNQNLPSDLIVERALAYYANSFTYTLQPPLLGDDPIDDFLFSTQRGFCEHFSSSFVYLMRAAGIPARVVLGYQGGEYREAGRYLVVRQSDAHAWAEVWLAGRGWTRIDPTAAVSPLRIERALFETVSRDESSLVGGAFLRLNALAWLGQTKLMLEEWDYLWQTQVMGYDDHAQSGLLERLLGGRDPWRIALFFVLGVGIPLLLYYLTGVLRFSRRQYSQELVHLRKVFRKLDKAGFPRRQEETPHDYMLRISKLRPELGPQLRKIVTLYYAIAYGAKSTRLDDLRTACRQFSTR